MESSLSSGSSKRAKAPANVTQVVSCLVDGCNSDLSQCREYHRRHKVCELHSKTPMVKIGGREQRFCQQCSRFHSLGEFDEGKRSCRKRLDGHNRRRRKPQSDSVSRTSGIFFSCPQGTRLLSFDSPQTLPPSAVVSSAWAGAVKSENDRVLFNSHSPLNYIDKHSAFPGSSAHSYKGVVNQFQFIQGTDHILPEPSVSQPLLDPNNFASGNRMFSDVSHRDRALSLLSSAPTRAPDIGSSHAVQPHNLHFGGLGQYPFTQQMESRTLASDVDSNGRSNNTTLHFQGMFQNEPDDSSASGGGSQQTLSFGW